MLVPAQTTLPCPRRVSNQRRHIRPLNRKIIKHNLNFFRRSHLTVYKHLQKRTLIQSRERQPHHCIRPRQDARPENRRLRIAAAVKVDPDLAIVGGAWCTFGDSVVVDQCVGYVGLNAGDELVGFGPLVASGYLEQAEMLVSAYRSQGLGEYDLQRATACSGQIPIISDAHTCPDASPRPACIVFK